MSVVLAVGVVGSFAGIIVWLRLTDRVREAGTRAKACIDVLRDPTLDDASKEKTLQRQSLRLFALSARLVGGTILALAVPLLAVWLMDRARLASFDAVLSVLESVGFLVAVTLVGGAISLAFRRLRRP